MKNNKTRQNEGEKYSELLVQFMAPFVEELGNIKYKEDIIEFTMNAWNFGNMKQILPEEENENIFDYLQTEDPDIQLLTKMIAYKISNFKKFTDFIVDFEAKETGEDTVLTVITQKQDDYLATMLDDFENENMQDEYNENFINRSAIIIKPLKPFIDWLNTVYREDDYDASDFAEPTIYLIHDDIDNLDNWLKKKFDKFFMAELENWYTHKKRWPQNRNYKMFTQWFQVTVSDSVFDTEMEPVLKSE